MENELLKIKEEALAKLADCSSLKELNENSRFISKVKKVRFKKQ